MALDSTVVHFSEPCSIRIGRRGAEHDSAGAGVEETEMSDLLLRRSPVRTNVRRSVRKTSLLRRIANGRSHMRRCPASRSNVCHCCRFPVTVSAGFRDAAV